METIMRNSNDTSRDISKLGIDPREPRELIEAELNGVTGGIGIQREPTYHPAKVTVPDIKIEIS